MDPENRGNHHHMVFSYREFIYMLPLIILGSKIYDSYKFSMLRYIELFRYLGTSVNSLYSDEVSEG